MKNEGLLKKIRNYFSIFEIVWFISLTLATIVVSILFPEESANGVSGTIITILYLIDVILAIFCELLTSKQSKWSLMLYNVVELFEIIIMIILKARFASLAVSIFFWVPVHTLSFINWDKHTDKNNNNITVVRSLKWYQSILIVVLGVIWTLVVGYLLAAYGPETDFYSSELIEKIVAYLDACCSAVSVANGVLLFFRYKENWLVWFIYVMFETAINIITGQWILLILKIGYFTNTVYGYLKWTKYIDKKNKYEVIG